MVKIEFSVIVCSFNPDKRLLDRALRAICNLESSGYKTEVILVDNNSNPPLKEQEYIISHLNHFSQIKIIVESAPGLMNARITGIESSRGKNIIFFDDDNEPEKEYLIELERLKRKYPEVGCWGPGIVDVDFLDGVDNEVEEYARFIFQERNEIDVRFSNKKTWQTCYPFGTGLCLERPLLLKFIDLVKNGTYTLTGRKMGQLSSGEDLQMVLFFIKNGMAAGVSPGLRVTHMIPKKRTAHSYLKKISFGTTVAVPISQLQIFPEFGSDLKKDMYPIFRFSKKALFTMAKIYFIKDRIKQYKLISFIAYRYGIYQAFNKGIPKAVRFVVKVLKLI